jgi:hypothetical protein
MPSALQQLPDKIQRKLASGLLTLLGFGLAVALILLASAMLSYNAVSSLAGAETNHKGVSL